MYCMSFQHQKPSLNMCTDNVINRNVARVIQERMFFTQHKALPTCCVCKPLVITQSLWKVYLQMLCKVHRVLREKNYTHILLHRVFNTYDYAEKITYA